MKLSSSVKYIKGIGPKRERIFKKAGINTVEDLLYYFPFRYEDRRKFHKISELVENEKSAIVGEVFSKNRIITPRRGFHIFQVVVSQNGEKLLCVWFNQPYLENVFWRGKKVVLFGTVKKNPSSSVKWKMENPEYEIIDLEESSFLMGRIIPVYERIYNISGKAIRKIIYNLINDIKDVYENLPESIRKKYNFPDRFISLKQIHSPSTDCSIEELNNFSSVHHRRVIFEELFLFELGLAYFREKTSQFNKGRMYTFTEKIESVWKKILPFELTEDQRKCLDEIKKDLLDSQPMRRLLQGEVGSGKTAIALLTSIFVMENGYQVAFMAPTEILAGQHFLRIKEILKDLPYRVLFLTGSTSRKEREKILKDLKEGRPSLVIGTHALFQKDVVYGNLGYVIIDEQHRFGVAQRTTLYLKGKKTDLLVMTATPIPRSLALTIYSDLDLSTMRELPRGRIPIKSHIIHEKNIDKLYSWIKEELRNGNQGYIVFPLIEESEKLDLKAAEIEYENLSMLFKDFKLGLIHGRLTTRERERIMRNFEKGEINLLVSTSIIEVGIDISNATFLVVENADRFGLAQLHQLRGRIGRGDKESHCFFVLPKKAGQEAKRRIEALIKTNDGFKIAEEDLILRGPGQAFGTAQWGHLNFRVADVVKDSGVLEIAKEEAFRVIKEKDFSSPELKRYIEELDRREKEVSFS
ncbi:MAG: ATP-dependent DNA helicase RecG [Acidobacteriota bacterium]